ncbi:Zn-ribbon domain-containing OB-fold protein [Frankia sp. AgKG'84/4]|uniref:Zn-ribbon domain-containing OB-fold protein n=1 Tax=Frankia sp. AgKG'84/4 TaxID=573490 RepID=UPI00200C9BCB|nr:OB-fold domain-containing protein [Frankia sp. AgKG'84/4]MCL9798141.1 OB-fold domain-containing protein [Frankia sp. AgKG'84/4]
MPIPTPTPIPTPAPEPERVPQSQPDLAPAAVEAQPALEWPPAGLEVEPRGEALGDDGFALRRCLDCRAWLDPVPPRCGHCGGQTVLESTSGTGVVDSFIVMRQPPMRAFAGRRPYALALVTLDEGLQLPGRLDGIRPAEVTIGQPVRAAFDLRPGAEAPRVVFRPRVLAEIAAAS